MWYCSISNAHECGQLNANTCTLRQIISSLEGVKMLLICAFGCFQLLISHDPLLAVAETRQKFGRRSSQNGAHPRGNPTYIYLRSHSSRTRKLSGSLVLATRSISDAQPHRSLSCAQGEGFSGGDSWSAPRGCLTWPPDHIG